MATENPQTRSGSALQSGSASHSSGPPPLPQRSSGEGPPKGSESPKRQSIQIETGEDRGHSLFRREAFRSSVGFLASTLTHMAIFIALALWMMPVPPKTFLRPLVLEEVEQLAEELDTVVLDERTDPATTLTYDESGGIAGSEEFKITDPTVDREVLETDAAIREIGIEDPMNFTLSRGEMTSEVPYGTLGDARNVADNYGQAIDQITQEILLLLARQKVLVVWVFDQSGSMKNDRQEIRDRLERVYAELGLSSAAAGDALTTAIASYGEMFLLHTEKPTSDLKTIQKAIDSVPSDESGKEMMCAAVGRAIALHQNAAIKGHRRMVVVLVSDESGEPEDNAAHLEDAIAEAKAARAIVYVLGREAVFGYPYAHVRWRHPQTKRPYWLKIDRGPETAFPEQIQTDGLHRRYDAHSSGFGPYAQSRLAHQTGGTFFMLPSLETDLVWGEKRRYELEAMRVYRPDLRAQREIFEDRDRSKLQTLIWGVISDLNPYNPRSAQVIEMRIHFSPDFEKFKQQVPIEKQKATIYIPYLAKAVEVLEKNKRLRENESSYRWQGNYDLMLAQLVAYQARVYEYVAYLDEFVKNPKRVPLVKPKDLHLEYWAVRHRKETLTGETIAPLVVKADQLFKEVIANHAGTPWEARAKWEMSRGYGIDLIPHYEPEYKDVKDPVPVPKL